MTRERIASMILVSTSLLCLCFGGCGGKNPPPPITESEYLEALAAASAAEAKAEALENERLALERELAEKKERLERLQRDTKIREEELYCLKKGSGR